MKRPILILLFIIYYSFFFNIYSQNTSGEIYLKNTTSTNVILKAYPVSMTFNNDWIGITGQYWRNYNLIAADGGYSPRRDFLNGMDKEWNPGNGLWTFSPNSDITFEFDKSGGNPNGTYGTLGFGVYKFDFYWTNRDPLLDPPDDYFTLEIDWGYMYRSGSIPPNCPQDIHIEFRDPDPNGNRIFWQWTSCPCIGHSEWHYTQWNGNFLYVQTRAKLP